MESNSLMIAHAHSRMPAPAPDLARGLGGGARRPGRGPMRGQRRTRVPAVPGKADLGQGNRTTKYSPCGQRRNRCRQRPDGGRRVLSTSRFVFREVNRLGVACQGATSRIAPLDATEALVAQLPPGRRSTQTSLRTQTQGGVNEIIGNFRGRDCVRHRSSGRDAAHGHRCSGRAT
jgi:hypothetical protein